jgi:hypothetical protein
VYVRPFLFPEQVSKLFLLHARFAQVRA